MGVFLPLRPTNPLASLIVEHEETPPLSEAELYRTRAAELRQEGEQTSWPDVRDRVLVLAEQYDLLADSLERFGAIGASLAKFRGRLSSSRALGRSAQCALASTLPITPSMARARVSASSGSNASHLWRQMSSRRARAGRLSDTTNSSRLRLT